MAGSSLLPSLSSAASGPFSASAAVWSDPQAGNTGSRGAASVTVSATPNGSIGPAFAGFSYEKSDIPHPLFRASDTDLIGLFKLLGPSLLRIGGDSADKVKWTPNGKGGTYPQMARSDVDALAAFVKATGWRCLYTVNFGGMEAGLASPELAADEVAYVSQALGSTLYGIEIGNEPDAYARPGRQFSGRWTLPQYEALWNQYRSAILAKTPNVVITGPAAGSLATWTIPFSKDQTKSKLSLLTDHYYAGRGHSVGGFTTAALVGPDATLAGNLKMMREAQQQTGIPFRIAETNSYYDNVPGVTDSYAAALWSIDFLFQCAQGGAAGVNFHNDRHTYSPISDDQTRVVGLRPEFYGILLFTLAGKGQLYQTTVSAGSMNLTAYAVKTGAGSNIVLVNKELQPVPVSLRLPQTPKSATQLTLSQSGGGSNLSASSGVVIQGATVALDGRFTPGSATSLPVRGGEIAVNVPAASAVLVRTA